MANVFFLWEKVQAVIIYELIVLISLVISLISHLSTGTISLLMKRKAIYGLNAQVF